MPRLFTKNPIEERTIGSKHLSKRLISRRVLYLCLFSFELGCHVHSFHMYQDGHASSYQSLMTNHEQHNHR